MVPLGTTRPTPSRSVPNQMVRCVCGASYVDHLADQLFRRTLAQWRSADQDYQNEYHGEETKPTKVESANDVAADVKWKEQDRE